MHKRQTASGASPLTEAAAARQARGDTKPNMKDVNLPKVLKPKKKRKWAYDKAEGKYYPTNEGYTDAKHYRTESFNEKGLRATYMSRKAAAMAAERKNKK